MNRIAKFEKISLMQFSNDWCNAFPHCEKELVKKIYEGIRLPVRATSGSAGYDFFLPDTIKLEAGEGILIPTGIRAKIQNGWVLNIYPRSGLGFKYRLQLDNTVGIIDSDYYNAENEGHIMVKMTNDGRNEKIIFLECGKSFVQGVFLPFGITVDDETDNVRIGGFGSTG